MNIHLTKQQLERVITENVNIHYDREQIPQIIKEIEGIVTEGKKILSAVLNNFKNMSVNDMIDNPDNFKKQTDYVEKMYEKYYNLNNRYEGIYDVMDEKYYDIKNNMDDLRLLNTTTNKLYKIYLDFDNLKTTMENMLGAMYDGDNIKDDFLNLIKKYQTTIIDASHQLPNE